MNATRYEFAVNIYEDQLEEASLCLLHTIIFHRTTGKYVGNDKGFQIGSVGFKDVNCKTIPLTYIMVSLKTKFILEIYTYRPNHNNYMLLYKSMSHSSKNNSNMGHGPSIWR